MFGFEKMFGGNKDEEKPVSEQESNEESLRAELAMLEEKLHRLTEGPDDDLAEAEDMAFIRMKISNIKDQLGIKGDEMDDVQEAA